MGSVAFFPLSHFIVGAFQFAMSSQLYFAVDALLLFVDGKLHLHVRDLSEWRKSQIKYLSYKIIYPVV